MSNNLFLRTDVSSTNNYAENNCYFHSCIVESGHIYIIYMYAYIYTYFLYIFIYLFYIYFFISSWNVYNYDATTLLPLST